MKLKLTLEAQLTILTFTLVLSIIFVTASLHYWLDNIALAVLFSAALIIPASFAVLRFYMNPINRILVALNDGFHNFLDNDFSVSIAKIRNDELGDLIETYNKVGTALRNERVYLYQRELLLDTVIQTTPLSLVLTDDSHTIIYSNSAARKLFNQGKAINGYQFDKLLDALPTSFNRAVKSELNGLFTVSEKEINKTYHLTQNRFLLNGRQHQLYLFKSLTKEINRQEVNIWKKVIRLISHELNNSLAPISSLAHSGQLLSQRDQLTKLDGIFSTIEERAKYLQHFIEGYAEFARLPKPRIQRIETFQFLNSLAKIKQFRLICDENAPPLYCDPSQLQQVIINLIKNAHESGSEIEAIELIANSNADTFEIQINDRGKGMSDKNLSNALLPFYSTKSEGTGLGLPLCREIVEAHGGRMMFNNRNNGGLKITLAIPNKKPE
ncbi:sensor histidine kinase [Aliikangiella coralliicola]|uniref:histidine kinase n=1 Tax=Aliikangiella coralliicola TaxID=2592383 RepID=A0A545U6D6_9GAMM|nr:ATP-binding protein [Aliikangiella coralliicola]TQV85035.1 GHKL domain-containing protein [Aliikangiella coralliicola]